MTEAERIIARFGGIRPMAAKLGIAVTTVQGWKERGSIPPARYDQILAAAEAEGLTLSDADLAAGGADRSAGRRPAPEITETEVAEPPDIVEPPHIAEPSEPPAPDPPPAYAVSTRPARSPARAALLGGLAGVVVAAGAGAVGWTMRGETTAGVPPGLDQRIAAVARRADDAQAQARAAETSARTAQTRARAAEEKIAALSGMGKRLEAAEAQARAAATSARAAETSARAAEEKLAGLATLQARLEAAGAGAGETARTITALKSELARLAARLKATAPSEKLQALGAGLAALKTRLDELASRAGTAAAGSNQGDKSALAALTNDLATIKARLESETRKLSGVLAGVEQRLAAIDERLAAMGKRLAALGKRLAEPARALGRRLSELEKRQMSAGGGRGAALIAGIGQLREAVRAGRVFSSELETVAALAGGQPRLAEALQRLSARAPKGVPTASELVTGFGPAALAIVRAGRIPETGGWTARAWARARSVVIVRRTGPGVKGEDTEAVVARAEARLAANDIAGAAAMLKGLKGRAAKAAEPWLAAAGAHIEAARAVLALHRAALTLIEGPPQKPAGAKPPTGAKPKAAP